MTRQAVFLLLLAAGCAERGSDPYADEVVDFLPGDTAGFGQELLPDVVLGAPWGAGDRAGSLDVLSLGEGGLVVLGFDEPVVDGPGVDLLVFENAFTGWPETGEVAVSEDGQTWYSFDCAAEEQYAPGCAGVSAVFASPDNGLDPTDPDEAGGDGFDLAELGLDEVWFVRITDSGHNVYDGETGGFDLDAVAAIH